MRILYLIMLVCSLFACSVIPSEYPQLTGDYEGGVSFTINGRCSFEYRQFGGIVKYPNYYSLSIDFHNQAPDCGVPELEASVSSIYLNFKLPSLSEGTYTLASYSSTNVSPLEYWICGSDNCLFWANSSFTETYVTITIEGDDGSYVWGSFDSNLKENDSSGWHLKLKGTFAGKRNWMD